MSDLSTEHTPYVFLSYASANREPALQLADRLESHGIAVWVDRKSIAGGATWSAEIVRGIRGCRAQLVLCSAAAMASANVLQEIQIAWESKRPILPLLLEPIEMPEAVTYALAGRQWIEIPDHPSDSALAQVMRALAGLGIVASGGQTTDHADPLIATSNPRDQLPPADTSPRHNLPAQLTSFVGREDEIATTKRLLAEARLVTLTGPGGTGKTRLAVQVASDALDDYPDGVWFVDLAPVSDPALVVPAIAAALGIRENPDRALLDTVTDFLRSRAVLLVIDNCEHLIEASARVAEAILRGSARSRILATSRELLGVGGELPLRVPPLAFPDPRALPPVGPDLVAGMARFEAVRLFRDRAAVVSPTFAVTERNALSVAQICWRLDGIPLALELAAARARVLTVEQIAARLDDRFRLLTGGSRTALRRQQTLEATLDWSHDLLTEAERAVLRRLAVFVGGWTLEAAEAVCADTQHSEPITPSDVLDLLTQLVDKSLVVAEEQGVATRYRMLETIRQYAGQKLLDAGEATLTRDRHCDWFLALAERSEAGLQGQQMSAWLVRLTAELDNVRSALRWSVERGEADQGLQASGALRLFWYYYGHYVEGRSWLDELLALPAALTRSAGRARALISAGMVAWAQSDPSHARACYGEALEIARAIGNRQNVSDSLIGLGLVALQEGDVAAGRGLLEEGLAVAQEVGQPWWIAFANHFLGQAAYIQGDYAQVRASEERSVALWGGLGHKQGIASSLNWLGHVATAEGDFTVARARYRESMELRRQVAYPAGVAFTLSGFANLAAARGENDRAARLAGAVVAICKAYGVPVTRDSNAGIGDRLAEARVALGTTAYDTGFSEGQAMTLEEAVRYALADHADAYV